MATHSNILAWGIPWTEEPGGLQSVGSQECQARQQLNNKTATFCLSSVARVQRKLRTLRGKLVNHESPLDSFLLGH